MNDSKDKITLEEARQILYSMAYVTPFKDVQLSCLLGVLALEYAEERGFKEDTLID